MKNQSVSDNPTEGRSVKSVSDNLTGGTIPLQEDSKTDQITLQNTETPIDTPYLTEDTIPPQEDSKTDQTTLGNMETPTDTLSSDKGPRTSKRKKKPRQPKVKIFYGER